MRMHHPESKRCAGFLALIGALGLVVATGEGRAESAWVDPNATQDSMQNVILSVCPNGPVENGGSNLADFQTRCNAVVRAGNGSRSLAFSPSDSSQQQAGTALMQVAPEQFVAYNTQATRLTGGQLAQTLASVEARMSALYAGLASQTAPMYAALQGGLGGAAGADSSIVEPFGVWFTNSYNVGAISSSFNQLGYDFGNWGFTVGADYRALEQLAVGAAFTYQMYNATFASSLGNAETDTYTGTVYAAYTPTDNLHVDASMSYGGNDYNTSRDISYSITAPTLDVVHTRATSNPGGYHYSFALRTGYNIVVDALTIEPYARFNYYTLTVDPYAEKGGDGWGLRVAQQDVNSLITTLGSQFSYALSFPWGVLMPQFHAEWHHQFKDNAQRNSASFIGDLTGTEFGIFTVEPTRNFATVGARLAATVGHGVSAVLGYDALLGYQDVNAHRVMLSARMDF